MSHVTIRQRLYLGAVAALTKSRPVWIGSLFLGAGGLVLFALTLL